MQIKGTSAVLSLFCGTSLYANDYNDIGVIIQSSGDQLQQICFGGTPL